MQPMLTAWGAHLVRSGWRHIYLLLFSQTVAGEQKRSCTFHACQNHLEIIHKIVLYFCALVITWNTMIGEIPEPIHQSYTCYLITCFIQGVRLGGKGA